MSVADARNAGEGTLIKVDCVVSAITYSFGQVPSGVILVDNTQSIYLYDANLAQQVKVGNTITVLGSKTWWILEDEVNNAQKFGYKGCCQLEKITLVSNDGKTSAYNKTWIKENTIKEIIENPVNEDITSTLFKVNAFVKKEEGKGFVNYYFYDLDAKTGSYAYTQCNGSDFAWLDQYDGKISTVYLTALNAKSSSSGCFYRLLPVEVKDEGFVFDTNKTAEHVVKYYGVDQFLDTYAGDPKLELITSVTSELLGFENATLSYSSDDTKVINFVEEGGKVIMNCLASGTATVTITVELASIDDYTYTNVDAAIQATVGDTVTVRGIVGPSLVNKVGFYLIDESGVIAVITDASVMETLEVGQEIILTGKRDRFHNGAETHFGQSCITSGEVVLNNYGKHDYSTATFKTDLTLADFKNLDPKTDYSTSVYVLKATVNVVETAHYTTISLTDGDTSVSLYCSSASQYSWLKEYAGQEVTLELAPCNWNNKKFYVGCVLAVYTEDGKVVNTLNFN